MDIIKDKHREELTFLSIVTTNVCTVISSIGYWIFKGDVVGATEEGQMYILYTLIIVSIWLAGLALIGWTGYGKRRFVEGIRDRSVWAGIFTFIMGILFFWVAMPALFGIEPLGCQESIKECNKVCSLIIVLLFLIVGVLLLSSLFSILYYILSLIGMVGRFIIAALDFVLEHWAFCGFVLGFLLMMGGSFSFMRGTELPIPTISLPLLGLILIIVVALAKWSDELYFIISLIEKLWFPILIIILLIIALNYFGFLALGIVVTKNKNNLMEVRKWDELDY